FQVCKCAYCGRKTAGTPRASGGSSAVSSKATETVKARKLFSAEERLGEREMAGWVFRKGEIVWVWIGDDEEELDLTLNEDWASWAAGAVVQKPAVNTALKTAVSGGGAFSS